MDAALAVEVSVLADGFAQLGGQALPAGTPDLALTTRAAIY